MWRCLAAFITLFLYTVSSQEEECVCVPYYLCRPNNTVITDGEGVIDERLGDTCGECSCSGLEVCCTLPKENPVKPVDPVNPVDPVDPVNPRNPTHSSCGYTNPDGVGFKVGIEATETLLGEFPWMIRIYEDEKYRCGGSLIHPSVVLTAAHCVKYANNRTYTVRGGEWNTNDTNEILKHQDRTVSSIKSHESFNPKNYRFDIALVFLNEAFELRPHINVICLPPPATIPRKDRCYATGWGNKAHGPGETASSILKKVDLPIINRPECQVMLRKTRLGKYFNLHESFVCAGGEKDKDTCKGDGGGPLACPLPGQENRYELTGITAWGLECNYEGVPGVYVDISSLRAWIDQQMQDKNLPTNHYQA